MVFLSFCISILRTAFTEVSLGLQISKYLAKHHCCYCVRLQECCNRDVMLAAQTMHNDAVLYLEMAMTAINLFCLLHHNSAE